MTKTRREMLTIKRKVKRGWRWADNDALAVAMAENLALVYGLREEAVWEWAKAFHVNIVADYHTLRDPKTDLSYAVCAMQPLPQ